MTSLAILRFFDFHRLMTAETLSMISAQQTRLEQVCLVKRLTVAALAQRRLHSDRTVVMTALTDDIFVTVEVRSNLALGDMLHQFVQHLAMREPNRLVLVRENADRNRVGNVSRAERQPRILP